MAQQDCYLGGNYGSNSFRQLWIIMASFSKGDSFFMTSLIPEQLGVGNYVSLFKENRFHVVGV